jgi:uncharacterized protein YbjT (DUF2867 family)
MYVITGASGNTGSVVTHSLLNNGKQVRVIGRNPDHLRMFTQPGAEAVITDLTDTSALVRAFSGAEGVYAMIPPDPTLPDVLAYDERIASSLASALSDARVPHVVVLSSIGADKDSGTGLVLGLRRFEKALDQINSLNVLHLRAGYFMENTLSQAGIIHAMESTAGPLRGDLKLPMIYTGDIGTAAAVALLKLDFHGHQTRELLGQRDISYDEATSIIGKALGKPNLKYTQLPEEQLRPALKNMGMSDNFIQLLLEMSAALNSEYMRALEPRLPKNTTPTSFETFVAEKLVPAYEKFSAAA